MKDNISKGNLFVVFMPFQMFVAQQIIRQEGLKNCVLIEGYRSLFAKQYDMMRIDDMWAKRIDWELIAQIDAPKIKSWKTVKREYDNCKRFKSILEENEIGTIYLGELQNQALRLITVLFSAKGYKIVYYEEGTSHYNTLPHTIHDSWEDKLQINFYDWFYYLPLHGVRFGKWRRNIFCSHKGLPIYKRYSIIPYFHEPFDVQLKVTPLFSSQLEEYVRRCVEESDERRVILMTDPLRELMPADSLYLYFEEIEKCIKNIDDNVKIYIKFHPRDNDEERKKVISIAERSGKKYKILSEEVNVSIEYFLQMFRFEKIYFFNASTFFYNGYIFPKVEFITLLPSLYKTCKEKNVQHLECMETLLNMVEKRMNNKLDN